MNGRIYDGLLGRFLSADVLVDGAADRQSYNRYSYVQNRPLSLKDETGFNSIGYAGQAQANRLDILFRHHGPVKGHEIAMQANKAEAIGAVAGGVTVLATGYVATVGAGTALIEGGRELIDEVVDQAVERTTGIPLPATSLIDVGQKIVKEGAQWLAKRGGKEGAEAASETATQTAKQVDGNPTPTVDSSTPSTPAPSQTGNLDSTTSPTTQTASTPRPAPDPLPINRAHGGAAENAGGSTVTTLAKYFPENNGFIGATERRFLMPGDVIDRFGGSNYSRFFSPQGVTEAGRALPSASAGQPLRTFQVLKPFEVEAGTVAPAFGKMGFGEQLVTPVRLEILLKRGIIKEVTP